MNFSNFRLPDVVQQNIAARGWTTLLPAQEAVLARAAEGSEFLVCAHGGSGKRTALAALLAARLNAESGTLLEKGRRPRIAVVSPVPEDALAVAERFDALVLGSRLASLVLGAGRDYGRERRLALGVDFVAGTPEAMLRQGREIPGWLDGVEAVFVTDASAFAGKAGAERLAALRPLLEVLPEPVRSRLSFISNRWSESLEALARSLSPEVKAVRIGALHHAPELFERFQVLSKVSKIAHLSYVISHLPDCLRTLVWCDRRRATAVAKTLAGMGLSVHLIDGYSRGLNGLAAFMASGARVVVTSEASDVRFPKGTFDIVYLMNPPTTPELYETVASLAVFPASAGRPWSGELTTFVGKEQIGTFRELVAQLGGGGRSLINNGRRPAPESEGPFETREAALARAAACLARADADLAREGADRAALFAGLMEKSVAGCDGLTATADVPVLSPLESVCGRLHPDVSDVTGEAEEASVRPVKRSRRAEPKPAEQTKQTASSASELGEPVSPAETPVKPAARRGRRRKAAEALPEAVAQAPQNAALLATDGAASASKSSDASAETAPISEPISDRADEAAQAAQSVKAEQAELVDERGAPEALEASAEPGGTSSEASSGPSELKSSGESPDEQAEQEKVAEDVGREAFDDFADHEPLPPLAPLPPLPDDGEDDGTDFSEDDEAPHRRTLTIRADYVPREEDEPMVMITEPLSSNTVELRAAQERMRRAMRGDGRLTHQMVGRRGTVRRQKRGQNAPMGEVEGILAANPGARLPGEKAQKKRQKPAKQAARKTRPQSVAQNAQGKAGRTDRVQKKDRRSQKLRSRPADQTDAPLLPTVDFAASEALTVPTAAISPADLPPDALGLPGGGESRPVKQRRNAKKRSGKSVKAAQGAENAATPAASAAPVADGASGEKPRRQRGKFGRRDDRRKRREDGAVNGAESGAAPQEAPALVAPLAKAARADQPDQSGQLDSGASAPAGAARGAKSGQRKDRPEGKRRNAFRKKGPKLPQPYGGEAQPDFPGAQSFPGDSWRYSDDDADDNFGNTIDFKPRSGKRSGAMPWQTADAYGLDRPQALSFAQTTPVDRDEFREGFRTSFGGDAPGLKPENPKGKFRKFKKPGFKGGSRKGPRRQGQGGSSGADGSAE